MPEFAGICSKRRNSDSSPPADAPMPMTGDRSELGIRFSCLGGRPSVGVDIWNWPCLREIGTAHAAENEWYEIIAARPGPRTAQCCGFLNLGRRKPPPCRK